MIGGLVMVVAGPDASAHGPSASHHGYAAGLPALAGPAQPVSGSAAGALATSAASGAKIAEARPLPAPDGGPVQVLTAQEHTHQTAIAGQRHSGSQVDAAPDATAKGTHGGADLGIVRGGSKAVTDIAVDVAAPSAPAGPNASETARVERSAVSPDRIVATDATADEVKDTAAPSAEAPAAATAPAAPVNVATAPAATAAVEAEAVAVEKPATAPTVSESATAETSAANEAEAERVAAQLAAAEEAEAQMAAAKKQIAEKAAFEAAMKAEAERLEAIRAAVEKAAFEKAAAEKAAAEKAAADAAALKAELDKVLLGTDQADELRATQSTLEILGGAGDDLIVSGAAGTVIDGGDGFNTLSFRDQGGTMAVVVDIETGFAQNTFGTVDSFINIQKVIGSYGADDMVAAQAGSVLDGDAGGDLLEGRSGKDQLFGGTGNDSLHGGTEAGEARAGQGDTLVGGQGDDHLDGGADAYNVVDYSLDGGTRAVSVNMTLGTVEDSWGTIDTLANIGIVKGTDKPDWMKGGAADIIFDGKDGDDILTGGSGLNELYGAAGNDTLIGGDRTSYLEGGRGDDVIHLGAGYNVIALSGSDGTDVVNGFKATDAIRLYNASESAEDLIKAAIYHEHPDGRDGLMLSYGDTRAFLAGVYDLKAEQIQLMNV